MPTDWYLSFSPAAAGFAGFTSTIMSLLIVFTERWHGRHTHDSMDGVQKFHTAPTPRIGGLAVYLGLVAAWVVLPEGNSELLGLMLLSALPAFLAGFLEDITKQVGVRDRLLATMLSGVVACFLTGYSLERVAVPGLDLLLGWLPFSILFTALAVGGLSNAVNIIDGFNGLAGTALMVCFGVLGAIAWHAGDPELMALCILLALAMAGFLIVNFPYGRIFLGDGGAYCMGFMLAWVVVMLPVRNPSVSPWAPVVVCAYPVIEILFSVLRKHRRSGHHPGQPDKVHFHMLVYQRMSRRVFFGRKDELINGMTTLFIVPFMLLSALLGYVFSANTPVLLLSCAGLYGLYTLWYRRLVTFRWLSGPGVWNSRS